MRIALSVGLVLLGSIALSAESAPAERPKPEKSGSYSGPRLLTGTFDTGTFDDDATIKLRVRKRNFNPLLVRVSGLALQCRDGTSFTQSFRIQGNVKRDGSFRIQKYHADQFGVWFYLEASGRIRGPKAKGAFYYLLSTTSEQFGGDCTTAYPRRWNARAVD